MKSPLGPIVFAILGLCAWGAPASRGQTAGNYRELGNVKYAELDYEAAISAYSEAIRLDPKIAGAYMSRGYCKINRNDYDGAIADENEAIRLYPEFPTAYRNRGIANYMKGDFDADIFDESVAIRMDPNGPEYYFDRSLAWNAKGDTDKAISDASDAIRLNPKFETAYARRAEFRESKGDFGGSIADFTEAIRLAPKDPEACNGIAWVWAVSPDEKNRDGRKAMEYAAKACELTAWKEPAVLDTFAAACAEVGHFDDAVKWENKALELKLPKEDQAGARERLGLYLQRKPYHKPGKSI